MKKPYLKRADFRDFIKSFPKLLNQKVPVISPNFPLGNVEQVVKDTLKELIGERKDIDGLGDDDLKELSTKISSRLLDNLGPVGSGINKTSLPDTVNLCIREYCSVNYDPKVYI